jgi:hypothetical protein
MRHHGAITTANLGTDERALPVGMCFEELKPKQSFKPQSRQNAALTICRHTRLDEWP